MKESLNGFDILWEIESQRYRLRNKNKVPTTLVISRLDYSKVCSYLEPIKPVGLYLGLNVRFHNVQIPVVL